MNWAKLAHSEKRAGSPITTLNFLYDLKSASLNGESFYLLFLHLYQIMMSVN